MTDRHGTRDAGRGTAWDTGRGWLAAFKRIVGMPNYQAYVQHLREHHPDCKIPSEREYYDEFLKGRYGGGFSRCC